MVQRIIFLLSSGAARETYYICFVDAIGHVWMRMAATTTLSLLKNKNFQEICLDESTVICSCSFFFIEAQMSLEHFKAFLKKSHTNYLLMSF